MSVHLKTNATIATSLLALTPLAAAAPVESMRKDCTSAPVTILGTEVAEVIHGTPGDHVIGDRIAGLEQAGDDRSA